MKLEIGYSNYGEANLADEGVNLGIDQKPLKGECPFPQVQGLLEALPLRSETIDEVIISNVIPDLVTWESGMPEIMRVLKVGGVAFVRYFYRSGVRTYRAKRIASSD